MEDNKDSKKIEGTYYDIDVNKPEEVEATRGPWVMDPNGYFLIRIDYNNQKLEVAFCNTENKMIKVIKGDHPLPIYYTIDRLKLILRIDHACYLGTELQKAYIAMKLNLKYVQDEELDFNLKNDS